MTRPPVPRNSDNISQNLSQEEHAHRTVEGPTPPHPRSAGQDKERHQVPDRRNASSSGNKLPEDGEPAQILDTLWWQFGQGAQSLKISALAAIVFLTLDLFQPGHMKAWQVMSSVPLYIAGVLLSFSVHRHEHRKGRAHLPVDISAGGRLALIAVALGLSTAAGPPHDGLAGWIALSALVLGSASDGAWIALVAARRRTCFWRAWLELLKRDREAQRRYRAALIGSDEP